jgi:hypothetical protein
VTFSVSFIIVLKALTKVTSGNLFKHGTKRCWIIRNHPVTAKTTNLVAQEPTNLLWSGIRTVKIVMTRHEWVAIRLFKAHPSRKQVASPYYMKQEDFSRSANRKLGSPTTSWTHENKRFMESLTPSWTIRTLTRTTTRQATPSSRVTQITPETSNSSIVFSQTVLTETKHAIANSPIQIAWPQRHKHGIVIPKRTRWDVWHCTAAGASRTIFAVHQLRTPGPRVGVRRGRGLRLPHAPSLGFGTTDEEQEVPSDRQYGERRIRRAALRGGIAGGVGFFPIGRSTPSGHGSGRWGETRKAAGYGRGGWERGGGSGLRIGETSIRFGDGPASTAGSRPWPTHLGFELM